MLLGFFAESKSEELVILQDKSEAHFSLWTGLRSSSLSVLWIFAVLRVWKFGRKKPSCDPAGPQGSEGLGAAGFKS